MVLVFSFWLTSLCIIVSSFIYLISTDSNVFLFIVAATAAKSCPTLCDPIDGSPPGPAIPGILQARTLEWVAISFSNIYSWVIFYCVYAPQLSYTFFSRWTSRLLPYPSYRKQRCNEHWGTCVSFNSGFLGVYAQQWDCWVVWQFYFQFFKESPHCSP